MKMPAAMASIARRMPSPPREMKADKPVRMSQMANNKKPMFRVNFIRVSFLLSAKTGE